MKTAEISMRGDHQTMTTTRVQLCLIRTLVLSTRYMWQAVPARLPAEQTLRTVTFPTQDQWRTITEEDTVHQKL
jgi:hypothetical protein